MANTTGYNRAFFLIRKVLVYKNGCMRRAAPVVPGSNFREVEPSQRKIRSKVRRSSNVRLFRVSGKKICRFLRPMIIMLNLFEWLDGIRRQQPSLPQISLITQCPLWLFFRTQQRSKGEQLSLLFSVSSVRKWAVYYTKMTYICSPKRKFLSSRVY